MGTSKKDGKADSTATQVSESQSWTLQEPHKTSIARGLAWAAANPPAESDLDALVAQKRRRHSEKHGASS
jgi:hypothetical protein